MFKHLMEQILELLDQEACCVEFISYFFLNDITMVFLVSSGDAFKVEIHQKENSIASGWIIIVVS